MGAVGVWVLWVCGCCRCVGAVGVWVQLVLGCSWCLGTVGAVSVVTAQRSIKRFTDIKGVS